MKKQLLMMLMLCVAITASAQNFAGYRSGNYTGVNGVLFNPASIANSRYRWDFNLFSLNAFIGNDKANFKLKDITSNKSDNFQDRFLGGNGITNATINTEIVGPSVMFTLNKKSAMAITTRARVVANMNEVDGNLLQSIINSESNTYPYTFTSNANSRIITNGWSEIGFSYAREVIQNGANYFKVGVTLKYLSGVGNNYVQINKLATTIDEDATNQAYLTNTNGTLRVGNAGAVIDNFSFDDVFKKGQNGIGGDIGLIYEYRPNYAASEMNDYERGINKYKFKIGVSLLDVGKINYRTNPATTGGYTVNINGNLPTNRFYLNQLENKNTDEIKAVLDANPQFFTSIDPNTSVKYNASLPSVLQADIDYHLHRGFFVSVGGQYSLNNNSDLYSANQYNSVTLTPRYEGKSFGVYFPLNYSQLTEFNAGLSLRAGPLFIGSGSIITAIAKSKQADVHVGLRFGILKKNKKVEPLVNIDPIIVRTDRDNDGVLDNDDRCPDTAGLAKYQGCPIPDTDGDGINDEEDKCPTVAGVARYQGCPVPDTDGDAVNDEEDKCPTRSGPASNQGCPEIAKEVIEKINFAAKNVFFSTGSYKLLAKSFKSLDGVVELLKSDETLMIDIDGHTDAQGSDESNQLLSDNRAAAVKNYFISKGVSEARLQSTGFGETKPVEDNKTSAGRAKNRRTEMTVRNY